MKKHLPLIVCVSIVIIFVLAYLFIPKSYPIYQQAMEYARNDDKLKTELGSNISDGLWVYSRVKHGNAFFEIPLAGNQSEGILQVYGRKKGSDWILDRVFFLEHVDARRYLVYESMESRLNRENRK